MRQDAEDQRQCYRSRMGTGHQQSVLIASHAGALDFSGIVGSLQVVGNGDRRQQDDGEHRQRNQLHRSARQLRLPPRAASLAHPYSPKDNSYSDPRQIGKDFHVTEANYTQVTWRTGTATCAVF